jgi:hypothetical protein
MWKTGALKAVATARSSPAARTAGLREVTSKKRVTGSVCNKSAQFPRQLNLFRLTFDMPAVSGVEIL